MLICYIEFIEIVWEKIAAISLTNACNNSVIYEHDFKVSRFAIINTTLPYHHRMLHYVYHFAGMKPVDRPADNHESSCSEQVIF